MFFNRTRMYIEIVVLCLRLGPLPPSLCQLSFFKLFNGDDLSPNQILPCVFELFLLRISNVALYIQ